MVVVVCRCQRRQDRRFEEVLLVEPPIRLLSHPIRKVSAVTRV
jgi:hypothetical protein